MLAPKSHQKSLGMRGHAAELTASPGGLSVRATAASQRLNKRCFTALRVARAASRDRARCLCISTVTNSMRDSTQRERQPRSIRRDACASAAASQNAAAPSPAFGLTHDSCPNGAPLAQREFYRVPPNSSALLVTFRAPAKSYSPAGARPGTRTQPKRERQVSR